MQELIEPAPGYFQAVENAAEILAINPDFDTTDVLQQEAVKAGIPWGDEMRKFVFWAYEELANA